MTYDTTALKKPVPRPAWSKRLMCSIYRHTEKFFTCTNIYELQNTVGQLRTRSAAMRQSAVILFNQSAKVDRSHVMLNSGIKQALNELSAGL